MQVNNSRSPDGYAPLDHGHGTMKMRPPVLSLSVDRPCGWSVLAAAGEVDTASATALRSLLAAAGPNVVVDLREVTFMDASGLGVLATSGHVARMRGGAVRLVGPTHQIRRILALTLLDQVLPVYDDLQEALTAV